MSKNIVLIGMPGSGKSTIGSILSQNLNLKFVDMDEYVELHENKSIKEMFAISETYFRDVETKYSEALSKLDSCVIATGGGIIKRKENIEKLKLNSIIIFINRPVDIIIQDINTEIRPLLTGGKEKLYELYKERIDLYTSYCDMEILNDKGIIQVVNEIIERMKSN